MFLLINILLPLPLINLFFAILEYWSTGILNLCSNTQFLKMSLSSIRLGLVGTADNTPLSRRVIEIFSPK